MISFQTEGVEMPTLDFGKVMKWLTGVATSYGCRIGDLCYKFCNDDEILRVNREFLGHDYFTDIITFDYSIGKRVGGDVIISLDTVRSNARDLSVTYEEELLRVIVHGVLHLCGLKDKLPGEREMMESAENKALELYHEV